jgi:hypothetical protein
MYSKDRKKGDKPKATPPSPPPLPSPLAASRPQPPPAATKHRPGLCYLPL